MVSRGMSEQSLSLRLTLSSLSGGELGVSFYINSGLKFGIQLLRNGDQLQDYLDRFDPVTEKHGVLELKQWRVIDFRHRTAKTPTHRHPHLWSVVFSQDFDVADCYRDGERQVIQLNGCDPRCCVKFNYKEIDV